MSFLEFLEKCPRTSDVWRKALDHFCTSGVDKADCKECVGQCLAEIYGKEP